MNNHPRNPILIGQAEEIDLLLPSVRQMMQQHGFYLANDTMHPGYTVPLMVKADGLWCMQLDCALDPERFKPTVQIAGPFYAPGEVIEAQPPTPPQGAVQATRPPCACHDHADAVCSEHSQPAVAQEAVAEIALSDDGYKIGLLGPLRAHRLPLGTKLYAAPVTAAPDVMSDEFAAKIAREAAYAHSGEHSYLPQRREDVAGWQPHKWVITAIQAAALPGDPASPVEFDRARETPRRQRAVELLLSMGYQWHDGEWIADRAPAAPGIDLEQFREAIAVLREHCHDKLVNEVAKAERLLALIDANPKGARVLPDDVRLVGLIADNIERGKLDHPGFYRNTQLSEALRRVLDVARLNLAPANDAEEPAHDAAAERCESGSPECGPVEHWDSDGVALCGKCWDKLPRMASDAEVDRG